MRVAAAVPAAAAGGGALEEGGQAAAVGGIRLEEALSREPAEVVEESRERTVLEEAEEAALVPFPRMRKRAARPGAAAAPRAAAVACAEIKVQTKVSSNARFHTGGDGGPRPMRACGGGAPRGGGGGRA